MRTTTLTALLSFGVALTACGQLKDQDKAGDDAPKQLSAEERQKLDDEYAKIPQAALVRVPVNEAGEAVGAPEMRIVTGDAALASADETAAAFDGATAPEKMINSKDELDGDTSTQSWTAYDNYGSSYNQGGVYGSGNGYGSGYGSGSGYGNGGYDDGYNQGGSYGGTGYGNGGSYGGGSYGGGSYGGTGYGNGYGTGYGNAYGGWGHNYWYNQYKPVLYYGYNTWNYGVTRPNYYNYGGYNYYCYRPNRWW